LASASIQYGIRATRYRDQILPNTLFNLLQIVAPPDYPRLVSSRLSSLDVRGSVKYITYPFSVVRFFRKLG
jgi:hypothetical protein